METTDPIHFSSSSRTDKGQVRENNEDNVYLWSHDQFVLAVVADGAGGAAAGEEASRMAIEAVHRDFTSTTADHQQFITLKIEPLTDKLTSAVHDANAEILKQAVDNPAYKGMHTTLTAAIVRGTDVIVAHVGNSQAYLVNGKTAEITQLTVDHSFVNALVAAGHITREVAEDHPMKNVLYRTLGQAENVDVDTHYHSLYGGDWLILCSDGLTRHVSPTEIAAIVLATEHPEAVNQKLIELANARGGEDNISVVGIKSESTAVQDSDNLPQAVVAFVEDDTLVPSWFTPSEQQDIFLSYSREDIQIMKSVRDRLASSKLHVWTDEKLEIGTPTWESHITKAIKNSKCLVVILSPDAERSEWVGREIAMAQNLDIRIFPVLVAGNERNAVPLRLISHQWIDARYNYNEAIEKLISAIHKYVDFI